MKIKMLNTRYDEETNTKIWKRNEMFNVEESINSFYYLKDIKGKPYGVDKLSYGTEFIVIEE